MATENFSAATDRGKVLGTELDALANGSVSGLTGSGDGSVVDNAANKDVYGVAELTVTFGSNPTAKAVAILYASVARDGTNYADEGPPDNQYYLGEFVVQANTSPQRITTAPFLLPGPFKLKFFLENRTGFAFPATGSQVNVSTFNRTIG